MQHKVLTSLTLIWPISQNRRSQTIIDVNRAAASSRLLEYTSQRLAVVFKTCLLAKRV